MAFAGIAAVAQVLTPRSVEGRAEVCPEYRDLRCVASALCAWDDRLGCNVCRCAAFLYGPLGPSNADIRLDLGIPPPQWVPPPK